MKKSRKLLFSIATSILALLLLFFVYYFWFTPIGYRMSVSIHGFVQISDHIYVENGWSGDQQQLLTMVDTAKQRVNGYFGETESNPTLMICDDSKKLERLGGDHDTMTVLLFGAKSYTSISSEFLNVDILAHELTHAETHKRTDRGGIAFSAPIPVWFDEGLAIQNDYREAYSEQAWLALTDGGTNIPSVATYDTAEEFYAGTAQDRRKTYCLAGHEVSQWISTNGKDQLIQLLEPIKQGTPFEEVYE